MITMEFLSPFDTLLTFCITISFLLCLFSVLKYYRNFNQSEKFPPGPWKLPLIGNLHQLAGGLPHYILRDLAVKHGPIMHLQLGEIPFVIVSSPRLAKEVLKTLDPVFAGRPVFNAFKVMSYNSQDLGSRTYDDYWIQMRKIWIRDMLNAKKVRSLAPVILEEGKRMISVVNSLAGKSVNMTERISDYTMSVVCRAAFGKLNNDHHEFKHLLNELSILASGFDISDLFPSYKFPSFLSGMMPKLLKIHGKLDSFFEDVISEHIVTSRSGRGHGEDGQEDLLDSLLHVKESGSSLKYPLTKNSIKAIITNVFAGGTETSSTAAIWAMSELVRNPRVMARAQAEIREAFVGKESIDEVGIHELKYLNLVIKETLRLHPPFPLLVPRECMEDCVVDGYTIYAKTRVMINVWAIQRDPAYWPNPESFIPERFENNHIDFRGNNFELIPFGSGKRICPGISLGLADMELPLALMLYYFDWDLPGGLEPEDLDMTESFGATSARKTDLCLIPILHSASAHIT